MNYVLKLCFFKCFNFYLCLERILKYVILLNFKNYIVMKLVFFNIESEVIFVRDLEIIDVGVIVVFIVVIVVFVFIVIVVVIVRYVFYDFIYLNNIFLWFLDYFILNVFII